MKVNYFSKIGMFPFGGIYRVFAIQKIYSLWRGEPARNYIIKSKINGPSQASHTLDKFFSDGFAFYLERVKGIYSNYSISSNLSELDNISKKSSFCWKKFVAIGSVALALQMSATAIQNTDTQSSSMIINGSQFKNTHSSREISHKYFLNENIGRSVGIFLQDNSVKKFSIAGEFSKFIEQSASISSPTDAFRAKLFRTVFKFPKYMHSMFASKDEAFLHLLNVAEGRQDKFYRDNKGIAIAYGWNPTRNSKEFNLEIAKKAGLNSEQTEAIIKVSETTKVNHVPKDLKKLRLNGKQLDKTAIALMPHYEEGFLSAMRQHSLRNHRNPDKDIAAYQRLPNNQQVVMIHMAYKVGPANLLNYKTFYRKLFRYLDNPNRSNLNQVQRNFTYTYATLDGQRLHDARVEDIHTGFFSDCSINPDPKQKENVSAKINQCRNVANITRKEKLHEMRTQVATIQNRMFKLLA